VYFGAEFTQVYASRDGARTEPTANAEAIPTVKEIIKYEFIPGAPFACQFRLINTKLTRS
jgi:hypothetical protein